MSQKKKTGGDNKSFVGYTANYILDQDLLPRSNAAVRAECVAYHNKSMSHGLEKFWATEGNMTSVKKYIEVWNGIDYKSDDEGSGFNV